MILHHSALIFAAFETSSTALARMLQLLSLHPAHQTRLRREIIAARMDGDLPYDKLMSLPFLDAIVRETLRVYACISNVNFSLMNISQLLSSAQSPSEVSLI